AKGRTWGRTVPAAPNLAGPGYFGVAIAGDETIVDYTRVPPSDAVPAGWPPVVANSAGLPGLVYGGLQVRPRGDGGGRLTGPVWRFDRDMGVFVTLVQAAGAASLHKEHGSGD